MKPHKFLPFVLLLLLTTTFGPTSSARILFYFGFSGHSHVSSIWPVMEVLGERGHQVTLVTSVPPRSTHPSVSVVHPPEMFNLIKDTFDEDADLIQDRENNNVMSLKDSHPLALGTCAIFLTAPSTQYLVHNSTFDLVIIDSFLNDCGLGLAALHYKCPTIVYNTVTFPTWSQDDYGIPVESSWVPEIEYGRPVHSFVDRVWGTWEALHWHWMKRIQFYPKLAQIFMEHLKLDKTPDFPELQKKTNLVLMNGYFTHGYAVSLPPLFVPIAGIGIQKKRKELPKALSDFISSGSEGFIYVSFGTQVQIHKSKPELRAKFFNAFASFPRLRFVWKWEGERPTDAPSNIYFSKWMPQQDLLAHPNIRGYIAHGGINGVTEGVHYGVPMILFPIFGDQNFNAHALASKELGLAMEITEFSEQDLKDNIDKILNDEALKARVKHASTIFNDRPMKPMETVIWWIEYVLRHGDTSFLMSGGVHQSWYERRLLDVWFFAYTVLVGSMALILRLMWKLTAWTLEGGKRKQLRNLKSSNGIEKLNIANDKPKSNGKTKAMKSVKIKIKTG